MPRLIDLSHPIGHGQRPYPGDPAVRIESWATIARDGFNVSRIEMGSHHGTHIDAPRHFFQEGDAVDQIELTRLCGPAMLVDLAPGGSLPPGAVITPQMVQEHRQAFGRGARVVYRTGWDRRYGEESYYTDYPSMDVSAARWIAAQGIALLGMDTPGPAAEDPEVHRVLLRHDARIVLVESLCGLERLPACFTLMAFPLKLAGLDGAPARVVAQVG